jgi:hypothetical protein
MLASTQQLQLQVIDLLKTLDALSCATTTTGPVVPPGLRNLRILNSTIWKETIYSAENQS